MKISAQEFLNLKFGRGYDHLFASNDDHEVIILLEQYEKLLSTPEGKLITQKISTSYFDLEYNRHNYVGYKYINSNESVYRFIGIFAEDYPKPVQEVKISQGGQIVRVEKKIGRNDPCFCGSGKRYKHCHMPTIQSYINS